MYNNLTFIVLFLKILEKPYYFYNWIIVLVWYFHNLATNL